SRRTAAASREASPARSSDIRSCTDTLSARLSRVGSGTRARLWLPLTAAELQTTARALPRLVAPLHRCAAAQAGLDGLDPRFHARDPSPPGRRYDAVSRLSTSCTPRTLRAFETRSSIISGESTSPRRTTFPF